MICLFCLIPTCPSRMGQTKQYLNKKQTKPDVIRHPVQYSPPQGTTTGSGVEQGATLASPWAPSPSSTASSCSPTHSSSPRPPSRSRGTAAAATQRIIQKAFYRLILYYRAKLCKSIDGMMIIELEGNSLGGQRHLSNLSQRMSNI